MKEIKKKIQPKYFKEVAEGKKNFEIRKDDSDYQVGDILILQEYINYSDSAYYNRETPNRYTGNEITKRIKHKITHEEFPQGIQEGYCVLGLEDMTSDEESFKYEYMIVYSFENGNGRISFTLNQKIETYKDIESLDKMIREYNKNETAFVTNFKLLRKYK